MDVASLDDSKATLSPAVNACPICSGAGARDALVCPRCLRRIESRTLCEEQIQPSDSIVRGHAFLLDAWDRLHALCDGTTVGRRPRHPSISVLEARVSADHARFRQRGEGTWFLRDLDSTNGTFVDGERLAEAQETRLHHGMLLQFAAVPFYFVVRGFEPTRVRRFARTALLPATAPRHVAEPSAAVALMPFGQPETGGVLSFEGRSVELSHLEFALLSVLLERGVTDTEGPVAGYVPSLDFESLPWNNARPTPDQLRVLVSRVRNKLARAGFRDLIESKRGHGYRLSRSALVASAPTSSAVVV